MQAWQLPPFVWPLAVAAVCGLAWRQGRADERLGAATLLGGWILSRAAYQPHSDALQAGVLIVDLGMLGVLLHLALRSPRHWPLYAAAFQLLGVATHLARAVDPGLTTWAYMSGMILWSYCLAGAIGYGAWTTDRAARA